MKIRHNKKRNTAFVYEALIQEATIAVLKNDNGRKAKVLSIIKKHFHSNGLLSRDLACYIALSENQDLSYEMSSRIFNEASMQRRMIDPEALFKQQSELIRDINKELSSDIFNNFVPSYKSLATIDQLFSLKTSPKTRVVLEEEVIKKMSKTSILSEATAEPVDNLLFKTFVEKFNTKYKDELLEEQKGLLVRYIQSFADNALDLKSFLNEEIKRLKRELKEAIREEEEFKSDSDMSLKANKIVEQLNEFAKQEISDNLLLTVLKTQALVKEIGTNVNNN